MEPGDADNGDQSGSASAEQRYRDLVEWLPAIVYEAGVGPEADWYFLSSYVEHMLGFTPAEMLAEHELFYDRLHPDDREAVMELERTEANLARRDDATIVSEYRMLHRDGHVI